MKTKDKLGEIFQQTQEMLYEMAKERGIDLDAADLAATARTERHQREEAENHELAQAAKAYGEMVDEWLEAEHELFKEKENELNTVIQLGISHEKPQAVADSIMDAVEVIRWYQHQIYVKLMRALMQDDFPEIEDGSFPKDSDGSAKVALIGMDRSISAWGALCEQFPEKTDNILNLLLHLDRLRRKTELYFPAARSFVRPGFDD